MVDVALAQALLQQLPADASAHEAEALLGGTALRSDPRAQSMLAKIYLRRNQVPLATKTFEAVLALDPNDRTAAYQLMTIYQRQGRTQDVARMRLQVTRLLDSEKQAEAEAGRYRVVKAPDRNSRE